MSRVPLSLAVLVTCSAPAFADEFARAPTQTGSFLPFSDTPASQASVVKTLGGYDAARRRTLVEATVIAKFATWFQLQGVVDAEGGEVERAVSAQLGVLEDDKHGLDLQVSLGWDEAGTSAVPAAFAQLGIGHDIAGTYALAAVRYDQGLEQSERGALLDVAALHAFTEGFHLGFDTQLQLDLERGASEPMNESTWALRAAPVASVAFERYAVSASAGIAAEQPRDAAQRTGVFAAVGIGAAL
jgi:hypothetical protein